MSMTDKELIEKYNNGERDFYNADLRGADLRDANIDCSTLPLWCGGLKWKIDRRIAAQLAYHLCGMDCDDPDFVAARNGMIDFANTFHRAEECGFLIAESAAVESALKPPPKGAA